MTGSADFLQVGANRSTVYEYPIAIATAILYLTLFLVVGQRNFTPLRMRMLPERVKVSMPQVPVRPR